MARQAEAERERRAKVIAATGELEASKELSEAAAKLYESPGAMQLRALQTLAEVASEHNSTLVFPIPIELLHGLHQPRSRRRATRPARGRGPARPRPPLRGPSRSPRSGRPSAGQARLRRPRTCGVRTPPSP